MRLTVRVHAVENGIVIADSFAAGDGELPPGVLTFEGGGAYRVGDELEVTVVKLLRDVALDSVQLVADPPGFGIQYREEE